MPSSDQDEMMSLRDWRQAIKRPPAYRVGNSTFRIQPYFITFFVIACVVLIIIMYTMTNHHPFGFNTREDIMAHPLPNCHMDYYNSTYPLTPPYKTPLGLRFRIAIISDLDQDSKSKTETNQWISYLKKGYLTYNPMSSYVSVTWDDTEPVKLQSSIAQGGRGMELSEIVTYNGKLYVFDDRTGIVYNLDNDKVIPWVIVTDGDGKTSKGFKTEWATVKQGRLYMGGLGKEWTTGDGELENYNPQWIKTLTPSGEITHINWHQNYLSLRRSIGIEFPGYVIHEAANWSEIHRRWFFLPRRQSNKKYNELTDGMMGTNVIFSADENFKDIQVTYVGAVLPTHGFSSFKFIPGSNDELIIALRSEEFNGEVASYVMAFNLKGVIILPESKIANIKFEGIEFI